LQAVAQLEPQPALALPPSFTRTIVAACTLGFVWGITPNEARSTTSAMLKLIKILVFISCPPLFLPEDIDMKSHRYPAIWRMIPYGVENAYAKNGFSFGDVSIAAWVPTKPAGGHSNLINCAGCSTLQSRRIWMLLKGRK
jgi:hypothetical protein